MGDVVAPQGIAILQSRDNVSSFCKAVEAPSTFAVSCSIMARASRLFPTIFFASDWSSFINC